MAIFLLLDHDNIHPTKDYARYKRGDIVEVFENDKPCVIPPSPPWLIVKILGLTKVQSLKFMESWMGDMGLYHPDGNRLITMKARRKFRVRVDDLPTAMKTALQTNRYLETTVAKIKGYVRDKETGLDGIS